MINNKNKITFHSITNTGNLRKKNDDYFKNERVDDFYSFVLCDGIGGKNGGEIAAKIAGDSICSYLQKTNKFNFKKLINSSFNYANSKIIDEIKENSSCEGMGTTVVLVFFYENNFYIGHVGDSRVYSVEENRIEQLTKDHSLIQELIDEGEITSEIAYKHPLRNIITHALGSSFNARKNYFDLKVTPKSNSYILLCSDGLNNMIKDDEIVSSFTLIDPEKIAENLLVKALEAGGKDNITITVIKFEENLEVHRNDSDVIPFLNRILKK